MRDENRKMRDKRWWWWEIRGIWVMRAGDDDDNDDEDDDDNVDERWEVKGERWDWHDGGKVYKNEAQMSWEM